MTSEADSIILCATKKGYPIPFMMGDPIWHHKIPSAQEASRIEEILR
jgi:hypothetical protein